MTLNDIIYSALRQLERGTDAQTVDKYRDVFTDYANTALFEIAEHLKPSYLAEVILDESGRYDLSNLPRTCYYIESITDTNGSNMTWAEVYTGTIEVTNGANKTVRILYRYIPADLSSSTDEPQLPEYMHKAIPYYIVACHKQDTNTETQIDYFYMFNRQLAKIRNLHVKDPAKNKLLNMW